MSMTDDGGRRRLGRGLAALIGDAGNEFEVIERVRGVRKVPIELLVANPRNPRRIFKEEDLDELAQSIRQRGLIQPVIVRPQPGGGSGYELIAGERRWRAAQRAGIHDIPVIIQDVSDREAMEIAIIENVQRQDLNALEEALGYEQLINEYNHTQQDLADVIGKSRSHVANTLRLLRLPDSVKRYIEDGRISAGHARTLITIADPEPVARLIAEQGLSVRHAETMLKQLGGRSRAKARDFEPKEPDTMSLQKQLSDHLGLKVEVRDRGGSGELRLHYSTFEQLDDLLRRLGAD